MEDLEKILKYYREDLKWNPNFAKPMEKYIPEGLKGYLMMRESIQNGPIPEKYRELIFTILDAIDDEKEGAKAHAIMAVKAGLKVEELVHGFMIVTLVKGINVFVKTGAEVIKAVEEYLEGKENEDEVKIEIYIPPEYIEQLRDELAKAKAGEIGNYDHCISIHDVKGFWRPLENANPFNGNIGEICSGEESKVEVRCRKKYLDEALKAIRKVHPYEEPLINVISVIK